VPHVDICTIIDRADCIANAGDYITPVIDDTTTHSDGERPANTNTGINSDY
jgi:hypothetical protein